MARVGSQKVELPRAGLAVSTKSLLLSFFLLLLLLLLFLLQ